MPAAASRMTTSRPASASARATARPTTPAPTTTQSTDSTLNPSARSRFDEHQRLTAGSTLRVHGQRIEAMTCCHEKAIAPTTTEAEVGASFGQSNVADGLGGGIEDTHAIEVRLAHPPTAPQVAIDIDAEAVG